MLQVLNNLPNDEKLRLKLLLRNNEDERTRYATSLAARFLKDSVVATAAEITRSQATLEMWYLG